MDYLAKDISDANVLKMHPSYSLIYQKENPRTYNNILNIALKIII
jgi:hypothetical protein